MTAPANHALRTCLACKSKKRQCDKRLPSCSRCARVDRACLYVEYTEPAIIARSEPRSPFACLPCRKAKRPCSNDMPRCSRCTRLKLPCEYDVELAYVQSALPSSADPVPTYDGSSSAASVNRASRPPHEAPVVRTILEPSLRHDYPVADRAYMSGLINHFCSFSFVPISSTVPNSLAVHLRTAWMRHAMVDPCLFHSTLFSASAHIDHLRNVPESRQTTYHNMQTVKLLRGKLEDPLVRGDYEAAAAVLALAFFNMRLDRHDIALTHRSGMMQMLEFLKKDGLHLQELESIITMMLLAFSMIAPHDRALHLSYPEAESNLVYSASSPVPTPSSLLESILRRDALGNESSSLTDLTRATIQETMHYIANHPQVVLGTAHDAQVPTVHSHSHPAELRENDAPFCLPLDEEQPYQHPTTARDRDHCFQCAARLFHQILYTSQHPQQPPTPTTTTTTTAKPTGTEKTPNSKEELDILRKLLRKVGFTSWLQHAPEGYIWICLTAAASASDKTTRSGFIMMSVPLLLALETTQLAVTRQAWVYFKWLERARGSRCRGSGHGLVYRRAGVDLLC
ncbi:hypothetical protein BJY00DRAFT_46417 [Aspergillus carlsbadensis]|nr:hypothetical protein BJY00DRAFT_46417 [Aspergillus carlsbadensis]